MQKSIIFLSSISLFVFLPTTLLAAQADGRINLTQAIYGNFTNPSKYTCDATYQVKYLCDGLISCEIPVTAATLCKYDPAPGMSKSVDIHYTCDGTVPKEVTGPDHTNVLLDCTQKGIVKK